MLIFVVCALKLECLPFVLEERYEGRKRGREGKGKEGRGREQEGAGGRRGGKGRKGGREGGREGEGRVLGRGGWKKDEGNRGISYLSLYLVPWKQLTAEL